MLPAATSACWSFPEGLLDADSGVDARGPPRPPQLSPEYQVTFSDEFDRFESSSWIKASPSTWTDRYGAIAEWDPALVEVSGGKLQLRVVEREGRWYGALVHRQHTRGFQYGYLEIRAKLPKGQGLWSGIWALPEGDRYGIWPRSGGIDLLVHFGREAGTGYSKLHFLAAGGSGELSVPVNQPDLTADWHIWGCLWEEDPVTFRYYADNRPYGSFGQPDWPAAPGGAPGSPFDEPFFLIIDLAAGGLAGDPTPDVSGRALEIDWVRVWQKR